MPMVVTYEDDTEVRVTIDGRDFAMFEREMKTGFVAAMTTMPITAFRYCCWAGLRRTGQLPPGTKYEVWSDTVVDASPEDEPVNVDPGRPEATEVPSSFSPSRPGRASGKSASGGRPRT